jgi:hypothetical protein
MRDYFAFAFLALFFASLWGIIRPYKDFSRKHFALATIASFVLFVVAVPPVEEKGTFGSSAANAATESSADASASEEIATKAEPAMIGATTYTRADFEDTYETIGQPMFAKLTKLEPGAYYAAAESGRCDKVESGAVSLSKSRKGKPVWFVDCANGNRFLISADQAQAALDRKSSDKLVINEEFAESCTTTSVAICNASTAQKTVKEAEVVTFCDMVIKKALISDPDMAWGWQYGLGEGDTVRVARDFTAQNAFGAELKHRYFCTFDAAKREIVKLTIEGPFGSQKVI